MPRGNWFRRQKANGTAPAVPDGLWSKCPKCGEISFARDVEKNAYLCPRCDYHHRLSARQRLDLTVDESSFEEMDGGLRSADPLDFPDYADKMERDRDKGNTSDAILTGLARLEGRPLVIGVADFGFMGGSMGSVVGEKIARAMEYGERERLPVVLFSSSGGARMQEGLLSLMQMAKTSAAAARLNEAAIPFISVLTHPTTGGVFASYAALGDIILAEPGATLAFAGRRVGNQDMGMKLPDDFQTSEFQFRCGMVDRIVPRKEMRVTLARMLSFFAERRDSMLNEPFDFEKPIAELDGYIAEARRLASDPAVRADADARGMDIESDIKALEARREAVIRQVFANLTPWNEVQMARHKERPYTLDYIRAIFDDFLELHGDRTNADDPAIVGGLAQFQGEPVVVLGHQKGRDLKERQFRNFGSARPAGFRKALRLIHLAEKFNRPLIVFVDTPAAEANLMAEEEGVSVTIATCLREMALLHIPVIVTVIGEGGSGGALAIAVGNRVLMLEHAVYSVIPPEGCAAILRSERVKTAADAAEALKLTAKHALEFELIDEIVPEPLGGAHREPQEMAETLKRAIAHHLSTLGKLSPEELAESRYARFRRMGRWIEPGLPVGVEIV